MEAILRVNYEGTAHQFKIISGIYREEPAWIVRPPAGEELILVKQQDAWRSADESDYDKQLVKAIEEAIELARTSGKEPFATIDATTPPSQGLF